MHRKWFRKLLRKRVFIIILLVLQMLVMVFTLASTGIASAIFTHVLTFLSVLVCVYIVSRKDKGAYKLTWVFTILLFPLFGGLFYLIFNFQTTTNRVSKRYAATETKAHTLSMPSGNVYTSFCRYAPSYTPQVYYLQNHAGFPIYDHTQTIYHASGEEMLDNLLKELQNATRYIFLEYFIVCEGKMWNAVLKILKEKAAQGVTVRLLYDDMGCFFRLPKDYPQILKKYGIDCAVFNPFRPVLTSVQNNRDHRKIAVIDGKVAITGGINLADEYINVINKYGHWKDAAITLKGEAAWSFTLMFLQMWELCTGQSEDYKQYDPRNNILPLPETTGFVQPYADSPMDRENVCEHVYLQTINNAKNYVYIVTPYLIIDDSMISALCLASKSGVDVRIVTPHKWDNWVVHMTTRSYYRELIAAGVKIYEYSKGFIHSKVFVSDDTTATIGTANLDFRSLYLHFECGVWMYKTEAVSAVKEDFLQTLDDCQPITKEDCNCSLPLRIFQDFMRVIAPLM